MFCVSCNEFISGWSAATSNYVTDSDGNLQWQSYSEILHKNIEALKNSSELGCSICRNAWYTLSKFEQPDVDSATIVELEVKADGNKPMLKVNYRRPNGTDITRMVAMFYKQDTSPDISAIVNECGAMEQHTTGSSSSFKLANFWLSRCLSEHEKCPKPSGFLPSRLLDVESINGGNDIRLVETAELTRSDRKQPFVALSHCWGKDHFLITKAATLEDHKKSISLDDLPPTFQDAVTTVRHMGFRYLWIDSLCIIQDSAEDWQKESVQMCNIYAQAIFTITSAHASSAFGGMFRKRDGIRTMPFEIELKLPSKPVRIMYIPTPQREFQWQLNDLPIYSRAWCFQEMVLSTRNLMFDLDGIRWECLTIAGSEGNLEADSIRHSSNTKLLQNTMKGPESSTDFFELLYHDSIPMQGTIWQHVVKDYAGRSLTKYTDKLIAIAGIAQEIEKRTQNKYLAGLWKNHLFMNLIWYIRSSYHDSDVGIHTWFPDRGPLPYRKADAIAPSWSWASVDLPVEYDTYTQMEPLCQILDAEVHGSEHTQTGKLTILGDTRQFYVTLPDNPRNKNLLKVANEYKYKDPYPTGNRHSNNRMDDLFHAPQVILATTEPPSLLTRSQILPVEWSPEEAWDERKPITFLAITRHPVSEGMSLELRRQLIYTLALVPTGGEKEEYRRIGLAVWKDCSWFAYDCAEDRGLKAGAWKKLGRSWERVKPPVLFEDEQHPHPVKHDPPPLENMYHSTARRERKTVTIV